MASTQGCVEIRMEGLESQDSSDNTTWLTRLSSMTKAKRTTSDTNAKQDLEQMIRSGNAKNLIVCDNGTSLLLKALKNGYNDTAKEIIEKGIEQLRRLNSDDMNQLKQLQLCLVKGIETKNRYVVKTILTESSKETVLNLMKYCTRKECKTKSIFPDSYMTPLRMLIKDMPAMAKIFLDKCVTSSGGVVTLDYSYIDDIDTDWVHKYLGPAEQSTNGEKYTIDQKENSKSMEHSVGAVQTDGVTCLEKEHEARDMVTIEKEKGNIENVGKAVDNEILKESDYTFSDILRLILWFIFDIFILLFTFPIIILFSVCNKFNGWSYHEVELKQHHPISYMIRYNRHNLLKHVVVKKWIEQKWKKQARKFFIPYIIMYSVFLTLLTTFALVSPRPVNNSTCHVSPNKTNDLCDDEMNLTCNMTVTVEDTCVLASNKRILFVSRVILTILAAMLLFYEYIQIALQRKYYFRNWENLLQMFVFIGVITFVSNYQSSKCGCESSEIWQLGALVVASAWFNLLVLLRSVPTIGAPINLFILIVQNYARLVYLPILLVATFGIPFHMLFVRDDDGSNKVGVLKGFATPVWSFLRTLHATSGDTDFENIFLSAPLPYSTMGLILFAAFIILVLVLFNNMLIGLAIGDSVKDIEIINIQCQAEFIISTDNEIRLMVKKKKLKSEFSSDEIEKEDSLEYTVNEAAMVKLKDELLEELQKKLVCSE